MRFSCSRLNTNLFFSVCLFVTFFLPHCTSEALFYSHFYLNSENASMHSTRCLKECNNMHTKKDARNSNANCMHICKVQGFVQTLNHECRPNIYIYGGNVVTYAAAYHMHHSFLLNHSLYVSTCIFFGVYFPSLVFFLPFLYIRL